MAVRSVKKQILDALDTLSPEQQKQVLDFTTSLRGLPPGIPGEDLLARAAEINFDSEDLGEIARAIEEGCERVDLSGW